MPPGGVILNDEKATDVLEKRIATTRVQEKRSSVFLPTAASKARQSVVPRHAVPYARPTTNISRSRTVERAQQPPAPARRAPLTPAPLSSLHGASKSPHAEQRPKEKPKPIHRRNVVPRLPNYPALSEDIAEPELYEDSWLSHQEIALTEVVNQLFRDAEPVARDWHSPELSLRGRLMEIYHQPKVTTLHRRIQASLSYGALSRPKEAPHPPDPALDIGLRKRFLGLWLDS